MEQPQLNARNPLIERLRVGDELAWGEFWESYYPKLMKMLSKKPVNQNDVEDLASQAMGSFFAKVEKPGVSQLDSLTAFLFRIGDNKRKQLYRHGSAQKRDRRKQVSVDSVGDLQSSAEPPEHKTIVKDTLQWVANQLKNDEIGTCVLDCALKGMTAKEIAEFTHYALRTVQARRKKILDLLSEKLDLGHWHE